MRVLRMITDKDRFCLRRQVTVSRKGPLPTGLRGVQGCLRSYGYDFHSEGLTGGKTGGAGQSGLAEWRASSKIEDRW